MTEEHSDIVAGLLVARNAFVEGSSPYIACTEAAAFITAQAERITALERERDEARAEARDWREGAYYKDIEEVERQLAVAREALRQVTTHESARQDFSGTTDTLNEVRDIARRALSESKP